MMQLTKSRITKTERNIYFVLFSFLYVYLWFRAVRVPFVLDEITTFYEYIQSGQFLPYHSHWDANNHFLNSAFAWLFYKIFGLSKLSLRLPNLLIVPLLFWAVFKIAGEFRFRWIRVMWVVTVCFTHFFLEYSALARGYGMSMAFILSAVWIFTKIMKQNKVRDYLLLGLFVILIVLSNLTLIYSILILIFLAGLFAFFRNRSDAAAISARLIILFFTGLLPAGWAISYLLELKNRGLLYYGITGNFWKVTVQSLVFNATGSHNQAGPVIATLLSFFILFALIWNLAALKKPKDLFKGRFIFYFLFFGNILAFFALHYLLNIKYPEDRIGLYLIPFFLGSFYFAAEYFYKKPAPVITMILALPLVYLPVHFLFTMNLSHTTNWKKMGIPERFYKEVQAKLKPGSMPPVVGAYRINERFWALENYRDKGLQNSLHPADSSEITDDYLVYNWDKNPLWHRIYDSIDYDPVIDVHLLKRKTAAERMLLAENKHINTKDTLTNTYFMLMSDTIDSLAGRDLFFGWDMSFYTPEKLFRGSIVLDVADSAGKSILYRSYFLYWQRKTWDGSPHNFINGMKVSNLPQNSHTYKLYLFNYRNQRFLIREGSAGLWVLRPGPVSEQVISSRKQAKKGSEQ